MIGSTTCSGTRSRSPNSPPWNCKPSSRHSTESCSRCCDCGRKTTDVVDPPDRRSTDSPAAGLARPPIETGIPSPGIIGETQIEMCGKQAMFGAPYPTDLDRGVQTSDFKLWADVGADHGQVTEIALRACGAPALRSGRAVASLSTLRVHAPQSTAGDCAAMKRAHRTTAHAGTRGPALRQ